MSNHKKKPSTGTATGNSIATQRSAILTYLKAHNSMTTLQARQKIGVCHPAARVMELKMQGHNIETHWLNDVDSTGKTHRVASYVLAA